MIGRWLSQFWFNTLKKIIFNDIYQEIEKNATATNKLVEFAKQFETIQESADQISEIGKEKKRDLEEFQIGVKHHRQLNKDLISRFLIVNNKQTAKFMERLSYDTKEKNTKFLEQILEKNNQQNSAFIKQISHKLEQQNFSFITQNSKLTKEILAQSLKNHGTINENFEKLVSYPFIVRFCDDLITLKTSMNILEKLDFAQSKTFYNLYLKYHKLHPSIPVLDMTHGVLIIKILFPAFFTQMLKNLTYIKPHLDDDTLEEMTDTIKRCDSLFKNFNRSKSDLLNIKTSLNSSLSKIDKIIEKLFDV